LPDIFPQNDVGLEQPANLLLNAFLYVLKLNGLSGVKASFLNGIPPEDALSVDGLVRAAQEQGVSVSESTLSKAELSQNNLPLILLGENNDDSILVVESYSGAKQLYQVSVFTQDNKSPSSKSYSVSELLDDQGLQTLSFDKSDQPSVFSGEAKRSTSVFSSWLTNELHAMRAIYKDVLLAALFINLFALASPLFVMNVYDRVVPNQAVETLWVLASGVALVFIFDLVIKLLRSHFLDQSGKRLDLILSSKLFKRVMSLKAEAFPESTGVMASQLKDFDAIKQFLTASTLTTLVDLPFALLFFFVIYYVGGVVVYAPIVASLLIILFGFCVHFPLKRAVSGMQSSGAQKSSVLVESIAGIETLKAFNAEGRQQQLWEQSLGRFSVHSLNAKRLSDSISIVSGFMIQAAVVAVVILGVYQIDARGMSLGAMIACVLLTGRALAPMVQIANLVAQYYQAKTALSALDEICQLPIEHDPDQQYLHMESCKGDIEIRNVSFSYTAKEAVLQSVNLRLSPGESVAIIGKIGSGKSTLMRLLLGLGRPGSGQLLIDGIDVDHVDPAELRENIAYVPQDIILFKGTLRENILLKSPYASQKALLNAAKIAGLYDFVQKHSMGFDMPIGEQGKGLSGGQRQSVAIARAVINNPQILLFDELTSAMDNQTEKQVIDNIKHYSQNKTMIISTHRASLLTLVDRIVVLDDGKIIADGPKNKVLDALKRGLISTGSKVSPHGS